MFFQTPITEIIRRRISVRSYHPTPIATKTRQRLQYFMANVQAGPLGASLRFELLAATESDRQALSGLGTYGFIRGATGFITGAVKAGEKNLEDYGYQMEAIILAATDLGLGTCWLGGSFTQSSFASRIGKAADEIIPAVTAIGYPVERSWYSGFTRRRVKADRRSPWESLFFQGKLGAALSVEAAGPYALPLEMVRLAPSASNKQPWRVIQDDHTWHFYLQRTPKYGHGSLVFNLLRLADLQRVDMGIAMCHFELTARESGLEGQWALLNPSLETADEHIEYVVSWVG